jgi:glycopeptide antibiotics resistance protein
MLYTQTENGRKETDAMTLLMRLAEQLLPCGADFLVLGILYLFVLRPRWKQRGADIALCGFLMFGYICCVLYLTLMPFLMSIPFWNHAAYIPMNMEPFVDVRLHRGDYLRQITLNVAMLMPFGFLFPMMKPKRGFFKTVFCGFLFSLMIELLQPLPNSGRRSDVTDLITNTAGAAAGFLVYLFFRPVTEFILQKINKERDF